MSSTEPFEIRVENLAIYSTYCGATSNKSFRATPVDPRYPHFFFTNNRDVLQEVGSAGWTPVLLTDLEVSDNPILSAHQAKIAKTLPHRLAPLAGFDYLFYKDDKVDVNVGRMGEFVALLDEAKAPLALRQHPFLPPNVLFEFGEAMLQPRYKAQWTQTVQYISEELRHGYKLECETLYATGAILRNMRHPSTQVLNETWYEHIVRCGIECQISFHFIAQRFPPIATIPWNIG